MTNAESLGAVHTHTHTHTHTGNLLSKEGVKTPLLIMKKGRLNW